MSPRHSLSNHTPCAEIANLREQLQQHDSTIQTQSQSLQHSKDVQMQLHQELTALGDQVLCEGCTVPPTWT